MIAYKYNTALIEDIKKHLSNCNDIFYEKLKAKTSIETYADKLHTKAHTIEAWDKKQLIGFLAFYANEEQVYITNISVCSSFQRMGIASCLMEKLFAYCLENAHEIIILEVDKENTHAILFYNSLHFVINMHSGNSFIMKKTLRGAYVYME